MTTEIILIGGTAFFLGATIATIIFGSIVAGKLDGIAALEREEWLQELKMDLIRAGYSPHQARRIVEDVRGQGVVDLDNVRTLGGWNP